MGRLDQLSLAPHERDEIFTKAQAAAASADIRSLVVVGSSNIAYLTGGVVFPYLDQQVVHPVAVHVNFETGRRMLFCTADVADVPGDCGWSGEVTTYALTDDTPERSLAHVLAAALQGDGNDASTIGFDALSMSGALHRALGDKLPAHAFVPADAFIQSLRLIKTGAEIRMLEIAARIGDRGYISALNHAEGAALDALSFPLWEYGERFRVHVGEFEGSGVGTLSVMQGDRANAVQSRTGTREVFIDQSYLRLEYSMSNRGYWISGSRTAYVGKPGPREKKAYADNLRLREVALEHLRPGQPARAVFEAVRQASRAMSVPFWEAAEIGHGVGTSEREAPYLCPTDETVLEADMVVVLGVYTYGENGELICNRDVYRITDTDPELMSWYKDWNYLYSIHGTSARHG
jgi:Xaa-Pro aminopeptidase